MLKLASAHRTRPPLSGALGPSKPCSASITQKETREGSQGCGRPGLQLLQSLIPVMKYGISMPVVFL